ncbi:MAG TPA: DEAD/DEAH box helicase [Chloroflexota bacterium]|nr:DEAD/DEAH box helicase [Chloroflexota bacterium]
MQSLDELGYEAPTPVQRETIQLMLEGRDLIAQAQTGTGKTAAYGIPIMERIQTGTRKAPPQALVLAPTRELAVQVADALHQIGKHRNVRVLPVYGGQAIDRQLRALRDGVHVVVGTPGRVLDHLRRGTLKLGSVRVAILDEADEMLDMGFLEDVESILAELPQGDVRGPTPASRGQVDIEPDDEDVERGETGLPETGVEAAAQPEPVERAQLALFSATMPVPVERLARRFLNNPARIRVTPEQVAVPQITQVAYEVTGMDKVDALARVLDVETPGSAIVFCATKKMVDEVAERLAVRGYRSSALHGDMAQGERERVLRRFRDGRIEVLVATDVAARGLDITGVTHVVNFDIPWDPESYVHRIGRTGRAGRTGDAITLVTPRDYRQLRTIEQVLKQRITRKRLPSLVDVASRRREAAKASVVATIEAGELDGYLLLAGELGDEHDPVEIAAAALRLWDQARSTATGEGALTLVGAMQAAEAEQREEESRRASRQHTRDTAAVEAVRRGPESGMVRIFVGAGRADGLRPQDLVGAIANEAGVRGRDIGAIDIAPRFSFVEVPEADANRVLEALSRTTIRGQQVGVRLAEADGAERAERPRRERSERPTRDRSDRWDAGRERPPRSGRTDRPERAPSDLSATKPRRVRVSGEAARPVRSSRWPSAGGRARPVIRRPGPRRRAD